MRSNAKWRTGAALAAVMIWGCGNDTTPEINHAPIVSSLTAAPPQVAPDGELLLALSAADPDGDELTYAWSVVGDWTVAPSATGATLTAPSSYGDITTVSVEVSDGEHSVTANLVVSTTNNNAPVIASITGGPNPVAPGLSLAATVSASDPNSDGLTYTWTIDEAGWSVSGSGDSIILTAPQTTGATGLLKVEVSDGAGGTANASLFVSTDTTCSDGTFVDVGGSCVSCANQPGYIDVGGECIACGPDPILASEPVAYFRMGDTGRTLIDSSTHGFNLTMYGAPLQDMGGPSTDGEGSLYFHGSNISEFAGHDDATWVPTHAFTIEVWLRTDRADGSIFSFATIESPDSILLLNPENLQVTVDGLSQDTGVDVTDNQWHHVAVSWQSSDGALRVYVDGAQAYQGTLATGRDLLSSGSLVIGQEQDSEFGGFEANQAYQGSMDEMAIFNRALSAQEVISHMTGQTCGESCDGNDNDGDGMVDEGFRGTCAAAPIASCADGTGTTSHFFSPAGNLSGIPFEMHCDLDSDQSAGYDMLRIDDVAGLNDAQADYRDACAALGLELIVPRTRSHSEVITEYNGGLAPNIVGVYPKADGTAGLNNWEGECQGVRGCSFYISDTNTSNCPEGGLEPSGDNTTANSLYLRAGCPRHYNDAFDLVETTDYVLCSTNAGNPPSYSTCAEYVDNDTLSNVSRQGISGPYSVTPNGITAFDAYCDQVTRGGGWMVVYAGTSGDNDVPMVSDTAVAGNPLDFAAFNLTRAQKVAISEVSSESIFRRDNDTYLHVDSPLFDSDLDVASTHAHTAVTITADDGTSANGFIGYSNFNIVAGGDFNVSMVDGVIPGGCGGPTVDGLDHKSVIHAHLNCACARHYFYSYSVVNQDDDASYNANVALGSWGQTGGGACIGTEEGGMTFYTGMR